MELARLSASSYSNTAPLIWSFLYGRGHGSVELVLDNAPARSAEMLSQRRVDAALVPVIAYHEIDDARIVPGICVGARERVRSVCLATAGKDLRDVRSVSLDVSSRTSVVLSKIIFGEFSANDPEFRPAAPDAAAMLAASDAALIIGDPALRLTANTPAGWHIYDLAQLWREHTGLGFIFAMWMTRHDALSVDLAGGRDEGVDHIPDIAANYAGELGLSTEEMVGYLANNITFTPTDDMLAGMHLFFELASRRGLIADKRPVEFI